MRHQWSPYFETPTDRNTGGGNFPDIRAAMRAAIAEHTGGSAQVSGESDDDEPTAAAEGEEADEDVPAPAPAADTPEEPEPETPPDQLLTDKEYDALQVKHKDDPAGLRKALQGAFTQKTQRLAAERKQYARAREFAPFVEAFDENPAEAIRILARMNNIDLGTPVSGDGKTTPEPTAEDIKAQLAEDVKAALGPDLDYLADPLSAAVSKALERLLPSHVEPLRKQAERLQADQLQRGSAEIMDAFTKRHPDWHEHEQAILALSEELRPGKGMTAAKYLDMLYDVTTRETREAKIKTEAARDAQGRFTKQLDRMNSAEPGEDSRGGTPDRQIRKKAPANATFSDAWEAAKRGERWEDED